MMANRRSFLKGLAALGVGAASSRRQEGRGTPAVVVVGAGAFGGWSALRLLEQGAAVRLVDAWGPGNSRASSGGETRLIRAAYGPSRIYTEMAVNSFALWKEYGRRWKRRLFHQTGVLWMTGDKDSYEKASLPILRDLKVPFEQLTPKECSQRWPQIDYQGVRWAIYEPGAGYLAARQACSAVVQAFQDRGGEFLQALVSPGKIQAGRMQSVRLQDGRTLEADRFVFACGPWLGRLFPLRSDLIRPTRQEVFYFGTPAGDESFSEGVLPSWVDNGTQLFYGMPGNQGRGFKIADDTRGPSFDPTSGSRTISRRGLIAAKAYLARRFPALKDAPLLEGRVCQYENSPDQDFILDRHPEAENVWLVGGGSGHGFKHGPAVGGAVAAAVLEKSAPPGEFGLGRLLQKE